MAFKDEAAFEAEIKRRLEGKPKEVCVAVAARAALRVWSIVAEDNTWPTEHDLKIRRHDASLLALRAIHVAVSHTGSPIPLPRPSPKTYSPLAFSASFSDPFANHAETESLVFWLAQIIHALALATDSLTSKTSRCFRYSAGAIHKAFPGETDFNLSLVANFRAAALEDVVLDATNAKDLYAKPLGRILVSLPQDIGQTLLDTDPDFAFWKRWYEGMVVGRPLDWELQRRIALIDDAIWEEGATAVAREIERIEADWLADQQTTEPRVPELEPDSVTRLLENPVLVSSSARAVAREIRVQFETFRQETGLNQTPDLLRPLEAMPRHFDRIADLLEHHLRDKSTEQLLREEIGRLRHEQVLLHQELATVRHDKAALEAMLADIEGTPWRKVAANTVIGAFVALGATLWTISGDELGPDKRLETLIEYGQFTRDLFSRATEEGDPPAEAAEPIQPKDLSQMI